MTISDEQLFEAAPLASNWLLGTLPLQAECSHAFSAQFERKMQLLLAKQRRSPKKSGWIRVALIALLSTLTVTMSVSALREELFRVVSSVLENGLQYYIRAENRDALYFRQVVLGYVPDGFEMEWEELDRRDLWSSYNVRYTHGDGRTFCVSQRVEERYSGIFGDLEQEAVIVQGEDAYLQEDGNWSCLFWIHGPNIMTVIGDGMTRTEILKIAEQIQW